MAIRPPGRRIRPISAKTAGLSGLRLITQLEITQSTEGRLDRHLLGLAETELDVGHPRLTRILPSPLDHLWRHVEPDHFAGRPDLLRGDEAVDACARADVQNGLAGLDSGERQWIPASPKEFCTASAGSRLNSVVSYPAIFTKVPFCSPAVGPQQEGGHSIRQG